jgi:hypothetical protein
MNKRLGRPATKEVGIIAALLTDLRTLATNHLGHPITAVVTSRPSLPGFDLEDLSDALEYAGLEPLHSYQRFGDIFQNAVVYAATGKGLCSHPEDMVFCQDEEFNMRTRFLLSVSFSNAALGISFGSISSATAYWEYVSQHRTDLGLAARYDYLNEDLYWEALRAAIWKFADGMFYLDALQVYGEEAADERFQETLKAALRDLGPDREEVWFRDLGKGVDPVEMAARGAAEFAKHFQEMTEGCVEPRECYESESTSQKPVLDL